MKIKWDVTTIEIKKMVEEGTAFFDPELSYEITAYRPINETQGLDFDPTPFTQVGKTYDKTKKFSGFPIGSKAHRDWWEAQYKLCDNGMEYKGYRITGDHYFFLNFYTMSKSDSDTKAGGGRKKERPNFWAAHYEYFHYIELCEVLGFDAVVLKSRGVGASEVAASLGVRPYITTPNYNSIYMAYAENFLSSAKGILSKCWAQLNWLNQNSETGMRRLRLVVNDNFSKRASKADRNGTEYGHMAMISGQVIDKTSKMRGDRQDRVFFEESGSNKILVDSWIVAEALVIINGKRHGIRIAFGTGGDEGPDLEGLEKMFLDPNTYSVLPYTHKNNPKREKITTGYFIPAWATVMHCMDKRGVVNEIEAKKYYEKERDKKKKDFKAYSKFCSEYCFYPEEALSRQGSNDFDQEKLADQYTEISFHKSTPRPKHGYTKWTYESGTNITNGVKFIEAPNGTVHIVEEPILDEKGNPIRDLYVAGIDSIDKGLGDSMTTEKDSSKFCITIKKRTFGLEGDKYVAFYMDRPFDVREAYEKAAQLLTMYNCKANLEDTKISIIGYFREKKYVDLLMKRPSYAIQGDSRKPPNAIGTQGTDKMIQHGLDLLEDYVKDYCHNIFFIEMIEQLQNYSWEKKGKFDIISSMIMCEIGDEELMGITPKRELVEEIWQDVGYYRDEYGHKRYGIVPKNNQMNQAINAAINGYNSF